VLPDSWQNVQRILVIQLGALEDIMLTSSAIETLRSALPNAAITMMISQACSQRAKLPSVEQLLDAGTTFTSSNIQQQMHLIELLSRSAFDAAIIFTNKGESPYPLAYICYLAGIPIRLGQSREFGGGVLSQCVEPSDIAINPHLFLLESAGFSTLGELCDHYVS